MLSLNLLVTGASFGVPVEEIVLAISMSQKLCAASVTFEKIPVTLQ